MADKAERGLAGPPRANVLGVGISVLNLQSAREILERAIRAKTAGYICVTGVHGVSEAQAEPAFRTILNRAFLCTPDGMPMVWMGRLQGFKTMGRVYGPDLMLEMCAVGGSRHFFYGGSNGVALELKSKLEARFPGLEVVGTWEPPWRPLSPAEETEFINLVHATRPDLIWVGLSTPKQERFMAEFLPKLPPVLMAGVGAAFDIHAGRLAQAPGWMQRSGLEWFYRLYREPGRLWRRYLRNNPVFVFKALGQLSGLKKYPLE